METKSKVRMLQNMQENIIQLIYDYDEGMVSQDEFIEEVRRITSESERADE